MKRLLITVFTLLAIVSYSQTYTVAKQWDKRFGGSGIDMCMSLVQTNDGGYMLGGHSNSGIDGDKTSANWGYSFFDDYWIVKIDANGNKQWDNHYGGDYNDELFIIRQTNDGGYILGGDSESGISGDKTENSNGLNDYWIIKIDSNGAKQWDKTYGGSDVDYFSYLQQTNDGGYIMGGWSSSNMSSDKSENSKGGSDYWIIKIDSSGVKQWDRTFGGSDDDYFACLQQTNDDGYILGGISRSNVSGDKTQNLRGYDDYWIIKINADGVKQWDKTYGSSYFDDLKYLQQSSDGGYILGGNSNSIISGDKSESTKGDYDSWLVKVDSSGEKEWDKDFGGYNEDGLNFLQQTSDHGFILGEYSYSNSGGDKTENSNGLNDYWILKIDSTGNKQWDKQFGADSYDYLTNVQQLSDGSYILGGSSYSGISGDKTQESRGSWDYWIVKTEPAVLPLSFLSFTATLHQNKILLNWSTANEINNDYFTIERSSNNKDFAAIGTVHSQQATGNGQKDYSFTDNNPLIGKSYYRIKQTDKDGSFTYSKIISVNNVIVASMMIKPNPSGNGIFNIDLGAIRDNISITVTDNSGRKIYTTQNASAQNLIVDLGDKPKGIYYLQISYDGGNEKQKLVIE